MSSARLARRCTTLRARLVFSALAVGACSDMPFVSNPSTRVPTALAVDIGPNDLYTGESRKFTWQLLDQDNRAIEPLPAWASPTLVISRPIVEADNGSLRPVAAGDAELTFSMAGVSVTKPVRVNPGALVVDVPTAYITQGIQRPDGSVPLVAGRSGHLRVFITGDQFNYFRPSVRVRFFRNGSMIQEYTALSALEGIPASVQEGNLYRSWNIPVPGSIIAPGTSFLVEVNGDGGLRSSSQSVLKFPASGTAREMDVRVTPAFRITFVPIHIIGFATGDVTSSNVDYYMSATREVWPLGEIDVLVREPYSTTTRSLTDEDWSDLLREIRTLRTLEGSSRYYHGILRREGAWSGLGYVGLPAAISRDGASTWTVAHELGHNFNRRHAPCGGPSGVDANFPHADGGIGVHGLSPDGVTLHPPTRADLMTYCSPRWVSDYSYLGVMTFRQTASGNFGSATEMAEWARTAESAKPAQLAMDVSGSIPSPAASGNMLIVSGEVGGGRARLDPAFTAETRSLLPESTGPYTIAGYTASGAALFSHAFAGDELGDGPSDVRHFIFAIPISTSDAASLTRLRVWGAGVSAEATGSASGGGAGSPARLSADAAANSAVVSATRRASGEVAITWDHARFPRIVVRNPISDAVLSIASGGSALLLTQAGQLDVTLSDGVRSVAALIAVR